MSRSITMKEIPVGKINPNPQQPRKEFSEDGAKQLAASVALHGVLVPIRVKEVSPGEYEIVAGERRWRAAVQNKLDTIPCVVADGEAAYVESIVENVQRVDLTLLELIGGLGVLKADGMTNKRIASLVGMTEPDVSAVLRASKLEPGTIEAIRAGNIRLGHLRALVRGNKVQQDAMVAAVVSRGATVDELEKYMKRQAGATPQPDAPESNEVVTWSDETEEATKTLVRIKNSPSRKGTGYIRLSIEGDPESIEKHYADFVEFLKKMRGDIQG